ncbi:MAG: hypothetical protein LUM44_08565 [Pyrinomonadaceae bacterium]|nr:hypothetical protein [Pyrinomonadaceae bacterium]
MSGKRFSNKLKFLYFLLLGITFSVLLTANPIFGQSGRRTQTKPLPAPIPEAAPEKKTPAPKPVWKPEISLKIVSNIQTPVYNRIPFPEKMLQWLRERLESSRLLEVKSQHTGSMKDAKKMAEKATEEYVVFVDLDENIYAAGTPPQLSREWDGEMWISFSVFAPQNAKAKQSGRAYLKPELLRGRGILSSRTASCYPTLTDSDYLLWQASFEAGEKIIAGFGFPVPAAKCGGQGN